MATEQERLVLVARAIRSSLVQLLEHVDNLSLAIERLPPNPHSVSPADDAVATSIRIRVDRRDFTVTWSGKTCRLGHTLSFRWMCEFVLRPNQYLSVDNLLDDVWKTESQNQTPCTTVQNRHAIPMGKSDSVTPTDPGSRRMRRTVACISSGINQGVYDVRMMNVGAPPCDRLIFPTIAARSRFASRSG